MKKKLSIKQIAEMAGVSSATVSRVLNQNGRYSEATKNKIIKIIKDHDYKINAVARSLRTTKSNGIGVIIPDITNEYFADIVRGIENYCFPLGYVVFVCNTNEDLEKEELFFSELESRYVDGCIYISCGKSLDQAKLHKGIKIITVDRHPSDIKLSSVESDNETGGYIATKHLIEKGSTKIVLLRDKRDMPHTVARMNGYKRALQESSIEFKAELVISSQVSVESAYTSLKELIEKGLDFDGLFAMTDWMAIGANMAIKESKKKIPQDIKVVGFDNISICNFCDPAITTINQNKYEMGRITAKLLIEMINDVETTEQHIILPVELVQRESS